MKARKEERLREIEKELSYVRNKIAQLDEEKKELILLRSDLKRLRAAITLEGVE
jgi:DNA repair exonuclease SbcCD ATPase subunit